jgi:hypothetical protein
MRMSEAKPDDEELRVILERALFFATPAGSTMLKRCSLE